MCREQLRRLLVGKEVTFEVVYKVASGREFGNVWLGKDNVALALAANGLVRVRAPNSDRDNSPYREELVRCEEAAKAAKSGIYSERASVLTRANIVWNVSSVRPLIEHNSGKRLDAVVELVRDPATLRVFLHATNTYMTVMLTGLKGPSIKRGENNKEVAEPFALEGRFFAESRVLHRDVQIILEGESGAPGSAFGSVFGPSGNLAEALLAEGFARCADWSISKVTEGRERYREAERRAKAAHLRIWKDYRAPAGTGADGAASSEIKGTVVEIVNPETIVVSLSGNGGFRRISLSSIRQPRGPVTAGGAAGGAAAAPAAADKDKDKASGSLPPVFQSPYMLDAREFLRKRLIGKEVRAVVDYVRPANEQGPERVCATVFCEERNVAEALVGKGLATVIRHRADDEQRSSKYDDLLVAEARASSSRNGVHAAEVPILRVCDLSVDTARAKGLLPSWTRAGPLPAVVEFASSASRYRM
jgi:staphylococcal nuclease domain-containing protein 1